MSSHFLFNNGYWLQQKFKKLLTLLFFSDIIFQHSFLSNVCTYFDTYQMISFQKAMKQQNIDFKELDKDVLGTESEHKAPPSDSNSWQMEACSLLCTFSPITLWNMFHVRISDSISNNLHYEPYVHSSINSANKKISYLILNYN